MDILELGDITGRDASGRIFIELNHRSRDF